MNPNYGWSRRPVVRLVVIVLFFFALASHASAEWKERVLYSFQGGTTDGALPAGGVVFDTAGNLYGATDQGFGFCPPGQCGSVFQLAPPVKQGDPWIETVLHVFTGTSNGDGSSPAGGLVSDGAGNLYGTAAYGGAGDCVLLGTKVGCGIVYEMTPPRTKGGVWTEIVLYSFQGGKDGYLPVGNLTFDKAGNLYGATYYGGGYGSCNSPYYQNCGTIFQLTPPKTKGGKWKEKVLYSFKGVAAGEQFGDGANPNGGLVFDSEGAIYGTTYFGGNNQKGVCEGGSGGTGCGIVFEVSPPTKDGGAWTKKLIHQFDAKDGANPAAGVIFDGNGNLYGTTSAGLPGGFGLIFELEKPSGESNSWSGSVLHRFQGGDDGEYPMSGLILGSLGNLYGAALGGATHRGVVFRLKPPKTGNTWPLTVLYNLAGSPDGNHPTAALIFDHKGSLYSTTEWGGAGRSCQGGCGTIFEVSP